MSVPWQICYSNHNIVNVKLKHHHTLLFCFVYHIFPIALLIVCFLIRSLRSFFFLVSLYAFCLFCTGALKIFLYHCLLSILL